MIGIQATKTANRVKYPSILQRAGRYFPPFLIVLFFFDESFPIEVLMQSSVAETNAKECKECKLPLNVIRSGVAALLVVRAKD